MEPAQPIVENEHHKIVRFTFGPRPGKWYTSLTAGPSS